jgi:thiol:disulfide interchange protein DsbC
MRNSILAVFAAALVLGAGLLQAQTTVAPKGAEMAAPSEPAPPEVAARLKSKVETWTGDRFKVEGVRTTPMPGIFEVQIRTDLYFVDEAGRFIIVDGELVDMNTNQNITRDRMVDVLRIDFKELPLAKGLKQVNGEGKRVIALFEDPNCAYCRRLRSDLMGIDNLTVYTFAYPILAADSDIKSRKALCAKDPSKAWNELMLSGKVPDNDGSCSNSMDEFKAMGERWGIHATPTIFFPTGFRLQGYAPPTQLAEMIDQHQLN